MGADGIPIEAILMTASGCGVMVKDHGHLLAHDSAYATKAARISALTLDLSEALARFEPELSARLIKREGPRVAYHPPCTLQHGQQIRGQVERLLGLAGVDVTLCQDSHLCCGSAGTYSVLQPELSTALRDRKLANLEATGAEEIVSANIGCLSHLQSGTRLPVRHWIELLDEELAGRAARQTTAPSRSTSQRDATQRSAAQRKWYKIIATTLAGRRRVESEEL